MRQIAILKGAVLCAQTKHHEQEEICCGNLYLCAVLWKDNQVQPWVSSFCALDATRNLFAIFHNFLVALTCRKIGNKTQSFVDTKGRTGRDS